jgi:hypothetical protein
LKIKRLRLICYKVRFEGLEEWQWQWMNAFGEGAFGQQEINWMRVWQRVGKIYVKVKESMSS